MRKGTVDGQVLGVSALVVICQLSWQENLFRVEQHGKVSGSATSHSQPGSILRLTIKCLSSEKIKLLPLDDVPVYALRLAQVPDLRVLVVTQHGGVEGKAHVSPDLVLDPSVRLDQDQARVASLRQHPILGRGWRHRPEK